MIFAEAPSNIALIKYMGKNPEVSDTNRPTNASLSYTLDHLRSRVEIQNSSAESDSWQALQSPGWLPIELSEKGREKFLKHFQFLKKHWGIHGCFQLSSANNFPAGAGIASSASSFAALTLATYELAKSLNLTADVSRSELADLSRRGSGSSGRSLFSGYCLWDAEGFQQVGQEWPQLMHDLIVLDEEHKSVSSSEAHLRILTSSQFAGRIDRVDARLKKLFEAFNQADISSGAQVVWDEFWDMHTLFHTSQPPFFYMNENTMKVLRLIQIECSQLTWPLVTMDAGANIHILYFKGQENLRKHLHKCLSEFKIISEVIS